MAITIQSLLAQAKGNAPRGRRGRRVRKRLRPIRPSRKNELWYKAQLLGLVKRCRQLVEKALPRLKDAWPVHAADSALQVAADMTGMPPDFSDALSGMSAKLGGLDAWAKKMAWIAAQKNADEVDENLAEQIHRTIGIDVTAILNKDEKLLASMKRSVDANVALIKSIPAEYVAKVKETVTSSWTQGMRWEDVAKTIVDKGEAAESRAKVIARDQTAKMNSDFNQTRQQQVGIAKYEWSSSQDERVRDSHAEMDGKVCSWDDPPEVEGERVHPGQAILCRCVALPVLDLPPMPSE